MTRLWTLTLLAEAFLLLARELSLAAKSVKLGVVLPTNADGELTRAILLDWCWATA